MFTPPVVANQVLDLLPAEIWRDPKATFLDPACKSGVFLREITRRLDEGLEPEIPDRQKRIDHILKHQVFGLPITEITALLARRSTYCSKVANGPYSVCSVFEDDQGNLPFERVEHTWKDGRCIYCGVNESGYERGEDLESHAYRFIHADDPREIFDMQFDVIVSNPPYQLDDGGHGRSASPIYQLFITQAKKLGPRYLAMIIPSRWFAGGKGLDAFRAEMLGDKRITRLVEFEDSTDVFPGVDIPGGICYFLWDRDNPEDLCRVTNVRGEHQDTQPRNLGEYDVLLRHSQAVSIIAKVREKQERTMNEQVSSRKPFGLATTEQPKQTGDLKLRWVKGVGAYDSSSVETGREMIHKWKVIASRATPGGGRPGSDGRRTVLSSVEVLPPGTICTETYLVIGSYDTEAEANNLVSYMRTKLFRFLLSQVVVSHDLTKEKYAFVPILELDVAWTDEMLARRYGLTPDELSFIDSMIRPMESNS